MPEKRVEVLTQIGPSDIVAFSASISSSLIAARYLWSLRFLSSCNRPCIKSGSYMNGFETNKLNERLTVLA